MVIYSHREVALGGVLSDDILIEISLYFVRLGYFSELEFRALLLAFISENLLK